MEGKKLHTGGRRITRPSNKTYRRSSVAIATEMVKNFSDRPGVIGWQIDNELTLFLRGDAIAIIASRAFRIGSEPSTVRWIS